MRPPLPDAVIERIRRDRIEPRRTQHDYLHLRDVLAALRETFESLDVGVGPALDLHCGTRPYDSVLQCRPVWGFDIDRHFGRADVVGDMSLPFRDGAFSVVLCTQALYLVNDPVLAVSEMRRIVAPGGYAVVTLPFMFRRETGSEHRYTRAALKDLFGEWDNVRVTNVGSAVSGAALYLGQIAASLTRRWPVLGPLLPGGALIMNACGTTVEALLPRFVQRWPANAIIVAQRPRD